MITVVVSRRLRAGWLIFIVVHPHRGDTPWIC